MLHANKYVDEYERQQTMLCLQAWIMWDRVSTENGVLRVVVVLFVDSVRRAERPRAPDANLTLQVFVFYWSSEREMCARS